MSTYGYSATKAGNSANSSSIPWPLFGAMALFLIWSVFQVALFNGQNYTFEQPIYIAIMLSSLLGIITCGSLKYLKWSSQKDLLILLVWLLPISYGISLFNAASVYLAMNMLLIISIYAIFYTSSVILSNNHQSNRMLSLFLISISYLIVFFGLFHWLGNGPTVTKLVSWMGVKTTESGAFLDAVMTDSNGARLTSVFQYANTYAAYLMAFLFAALFMVTISRKWWEKAIHSFMLVPIILSIFLTLSRGGLVLLPVVFIILLVFLKPHRQIMWILHLAVSGVITFVILNSVTDIGLKVQESFSAPLSFKGWAFILIGSIISAALSVVLERFVSPWVEGKLTGLANKKWGNLLLPIGGVVAAGLLLFILMGTEVKNMLPENVQTRLENINFAQHSVLERITFYKDSAKLLADHPLIGAGGGAWGAMYEQYQNNPYTSRQAHSFYMQYLDEVGIIGFIIFAAFLGYILYKYICTYVRANQEHRDQYFIYFIIATSILVHSVMDFNMSYAFIGILVFICLGGMTASIDSKPFMKLKWKPKTMRTWISIVTGVISLVLLITSITFVSASSSYKKASELIQTSTDYNEITAPLDKALKIRPHHPDYVLLKSNLLTVAYKQTQDEQYFDAAYSLLQETLNSEPSNKNLLLRLSELYSLKNMNQEIVDLYRNNLYRFPWDIEWYEKYMEKAIVLATSDSNTEESKKEYIQATLDSLQKIQNGIDHLKTLPEGQLQGRPFEITTKIALHAGQAYYLNNQVQEAYDLMKPYLSDQLAIEGDVTEAEYQQIMSNRLLMRWYLASAEKLGIKDESNLAKLIAADPAEESSINVILEMNID